MAQFPWGNWGSCSGSWLGRSISSFNQEHRHRNTPAGIEAGAVCDNAGAP